MSTRIMDETRNEALQRLCRGYLSRLRYVASKHGLLPQLNSIIAMNKRQECVGTEREVQMLSRMVDDERISRSDIPNLLGKSYRQCCEDGDFDKIEKLKRVGVYSKLDVLLHKVNLYNTHCKNCNKNKRYGN